MALELPDLVKGACLAAIAPGGLLPITGVFAAIGAGVVLRWYYDILSPMKVGDAREPGRTLLQWGMVTGLAVLFILLLRAMAGGLLVPPADDLGPALRVVLGLDGAAFTLRHAVRLLIRIMRPPAQPKTTIIPELDFRTPIEGSDGAPLPEPVKLETQVQEVPRNARGDVIGLACGLVMLWAGLHGWNMHSLCLLKLPG